MRYKYIICSNVRHSINRFLTSILTISVHCVRSMGLMLMLYHVRAMLFYTYFSYVYMYDLFVYIYVYIHVYKMYIYIPLQILCQIIKHIRQTIAMYDGVPTIPNIKIIPVRPEFRFKCKHISFWLRPASYVIWHSCRAFFITTRVLCIPRSANKTATQTTPSNVPTFRPPKQQAMRAVFIFLNCSKLIG